MLHEEEEPESRHQGTGSVLRALHQRYEPGNDPDRPDRDLGERGNALGLGGQQAHQARRDGGGEGGQHESEKEPSAHERSANIARAGPES